MLAGFRIRSLNVHQMGDLCTSTDPSLHACRALPSRTSRKDFPQNRWKPPQNTPKHIPRRENVLREGCRTVVDLPLRNSRENNIGKIWISMDLEGFPMDFEGFSRNMKNIRRTVKCLEVL